MAKRHDGDFDEVSNKTLTALYDCEGQPKINALLLLAVFS